MVWLRRRSTARRCHGGADVPQRGDQGREQIARRLGLLNVIGLRVEPIGAPVQSGRYVGEAVRFYQHQGTGTGEGILVFELDKSGQIAHQWIMGETRD